MFSIERIANSSYLLYNKAVFSAVMSTVALVGASSVMADEPLNVDCEVLASVNDAANDFLLSQNVEFKNLGEFFSSALRNEGLAGQLIMLYSGLSGGAIQFVSGSQGITTNAKCGLIPQLGDFDILLH